MGLPFDISFDFSVLETLGNAPFYYLLWYFFINGGWIIFAIVVLWGLFMINVARLEDKYAAKQSYVFLAIDIPKTNLQSPKAVENIFSIIAGAHSPLEWEEKHFEGKFQLGFSFEIVGIDGYIQYVIRTAVQFRDLVESAFYAQYPDIEITEVEDYAKDLNLTFPNDEYQLWGTDLVHVAPYYLPIKVYTEFEHPMSKDIKDPLIALLEIMNKLKPGEQMWYQILVYPYEPKWTAEGVKALKKLGGDDVSGSQSTLDRVLEFPVTLLGEVSEQLFGMFSAPAVKKDEKTRYFLPPLEKIQADGISRKISKMAFKVKWRVIYLAKKEVFNKYWGASALIGVVKQFTDINLNSFKPDRNKTDYRWPWFNDTIKNQKRTAIFNFYKKRSADSGSPKTILNTEELATLYHFPYFEVYSPRVKKIDSKKSKAPAHLPSGIGLPVDDSSVTTEKNFDLVPVVDYDDDYFEERFAKDKTGKADKLRKAEIVEKMKGMKSSKNQAEPQATKPSTAADDFMTKFAKQMSPSQGKPTSAEKPKGQPPSNLPFSN